MYIPKKFRQENINELINTIEGHPFATVISYSGAEVEATHLPMLITQKDEATQEQPWSITDAPESYIEKMLSAIVGIEVEVSAMIGKWKIGQNHPLINQQGVIKNLSESPDTEAQTIAKMMNKQISSS